jgi:hypothetical protein
MRMSMLAMGIALCSGCSVSWGNGCEHEAEQQWQVDAAGVTSLEISAAAGSFELHGEEGLDAIEYSGLACSDDKDALQQIRLAQRREGDRLVLTAELPEQGNWSNGPRLDISLRVPARMQIELTDTSGALEVSGVASARIDDTSGEIRVSAIAGDVEIRDTSGAIRVADVQGNVLIPSDSSGSIELVDIRGDAVVEEDSSGSIEFRRIGGTARVDKDSSGSISAREIGGDFIVLEDGSGSIDHDDVSGEVRIPERKR